MPSRSPEAAMACSRFGQKFVFTRIYGLAANGGTDLFAPGGKSALKGGFC